MVLPDHVTIAISCQGSCHVVLDGSQKARGKGMWSWVRFHDLQASNHFCQSIEGDNMRAEPGLGKGIGAHN
eukprot:9187332-Lingulodinium_polyedra.AAC.1